MAPSSALQLASPMRLKLSMPAVPSMSVVQPESDQGMYEQPKMPNAMASSPAGTTNRRFIAVSPLVVCRLLPLLLPRTVVDGVLVSGARHRHVPLDRPVVGILPPLVRVR